MTSQQTRRRTLLQVIAASSTASIAALAGCGSPADDADGGEATTTEGEMTTTDEVETTDEAGTTDEAETTVADDETTTAGDGGGLSGEDYPNVDEWLTETDVGDAAPNYDGSIVDERDADAVSVAVGAGSTGFAFEPAAVAVSTGTTVTWEWTGEGGAHNVEAEPGDQIQASDYEFSSGDPVESDTETFEQSFDEAGVALYHCEPHLAVGMKGAVVVVE